MPQKTNRSKKRINNMRKLIYIIVFISLFCKVSAQKLPERSLVRKGNRAYNKGDYESSKVRYEEALKYAPTSFETNYNLSNALYKTEKYEQSEEQFKKVTVDSLQVDSLRAIAHYNLGNSQFKQEKYQEALESYKQSLRLNPSDMETKYNYAYTKKLLDDNKDKDDQDKDNEDEDENKDQDKKDSEENQDKSDQEENPQDKDKGDEEKDEKDSEPQPTETGISPKEQEQMLEAIQAQEDKTQDKLKDKKGVIVRGKKSW